MNSSAAHHDHVHRFSATRSPYPYPGFVHQQRHELMMHRARMMKPFGADYMEGYHAYGMRWQPPGSYPPHFGRQYGMMESCHYPPYGQMMPPQHYPFDRISMHPPLDRFQRMPQPIRREVCFPPNCVEATQPRPGKTRRLTHRQINGVDPWRLMMALKSGLLSESTWALDVLGVLLRDDVTVPWFGLQHLPGLIEVLLEHIRRCLIELFPGDFDDLEVVFETAPVKSRGNDAEDWRTDCHDEPLPRSCPSKSVGGSPVVDVEANSPDEELVFDDKRWDIYGDVDSSMLDWQMGRGDLTTHIQTRFNRPGSLDFAINQFFDQSLRAKSATDQASKTVEDVSDGHSRKREYSTSSPTEKNAEVSMCRGDTSGSAREQLCSIAGPETVGPCEVVQLRPVEKISVQFVSSSGTESLEFAVEKSDAGPAAETGTDRTGATGCRHELCRKTLTAEDPDDGDEGWLRAELKRLWSDEWDRDDDPDDTSDVPVLSVVGDDHQDTACRCLALSNIIRGLSFVPGNDAELARHPGVVAALSRLLLFRHQHSGAASRCDDDEVLVGRRGRDVADVLREDALVTFANVAGQLELAAYPEEICVPVLDGLLHWASCGAPRAVDPLPSATYRRDPVSAQRLALEALCKLCVTDANVDLLLATPPFDRLVAVLGRLVGAMASPDCDQVWREFAIVLASSLVAAEPGVARALAVHRCTVPVLVAFVEAASADPGAGTSADMVRRATAVLRAVAELPEGRCDLARNYQCRLLQLAVSPSLDSTVLAAFAHILHLCSGV